MYRDLARNLRKNMTDAERRLWSELRRRQIESCKFRRQAPIGPFIADFVSFEKKLIIELDGGQHAERVEEDATRTKWFVEQGFTILRFWNHQVFEELDGVLESIWQFVASSPPPQPSPTRGEGEAEPPLQGKGGSQPPTPTLPHKGGGGRKGQR